MRISRFPSLTALLVVSALTVMTACMGQVDEEDESLVAQNLREQAACGLTDGTVGRHDQVRACDPANKKKTTICHVPPGNPANAHTLCIGNAAVKAHLRNHPDYLGPCKRENPCPPPPPPAADAGAPGGGGTGGAGGAGGAGGTGGAEGTPPTGGADAGRFVIE
jgi:hypothetical protein